MPFQVAASGKSMVLCSCLVQNNFQVKQLYNVIWSNYIIIHKMGDWIYFSLQVLMLISCTFHIQSKYKGAKKKKVTLLSQNDLQINQDDFIYLQNKILVYGIIFQTNKYTKFIISYLLIIFIIAQQNEKYCYKMLMIQQ